MDTIELIEDLIAYNKRYNMPVSYIMLGERVYDRLIHELQNAGLIRATAALKTARPMYNGYQIHINYITEYAIGVL